MWSENDHFVRLGEELKVFADGLHYTEHMEIWMQSVLAALALPEYGLSTVFVVALVSATLLPLGSEPVVFGLVKLNPELFWPAVLVATAGNTIGGAISWWMGSGAHKVSDKLRHKETTAQDARALRWLHALGPKACLLSWLPGVGDPLCAVAGWLRLPFWPCVAYMAVGKFARYVVMTAGLLWVFPQHWGIG
jgi:membrane protein YqaA with SNARE-associated domain